MHREIENCMHKNTYQLSVYQDVNQDFNFELQENRETMKNK